MGIPNSIGRKAAVLSLALGMGLNIGTPAGRRLWAMPVPGPRRPEAPLPRGLVYVRIQRPGGEKVEHPHLTVPVRPVDGALLDDPLGTANPLLIERLDVKNEPWLVLERQLAASNRATSAGTVSVQRLQVLDAKPLPAGVQLLVGATGLAVCSVAASPDPDLVAIRRPRRADARQSQFRDLLMAWRVDRRSLRLRPVTPGLVRCRNTAQGVP